MDRSNIVFGARDARSVKRDRRAIGNLEVEIGSRPRQHATVLHNIAFCESGYVNRPALALRYGIEGRRIDGVAGHSRNGGRPASERVGVFCRLSFGRRLAAVSGRLTVLDRARCNRLTLDNPRDRVAAFRRVELRRVGRIARHGRNRRRPASELVSVFRRRFLGRRHAAINGRLTILDRAGRNRLTLDNPRDRVAALRLRELRSVGRVTRHGNNRRIPASECVAVFRRRFLRRCIAVVSGRLTILDRAGRNRLTLDNPRDRVAALRRIERRRVSRRAGDGHNSRRPASERVGIFSSLSLRRRGVCRGGAVCYRRCANERVVVIEPRNRVGT